MFTVVMFMLVIASSDRAVSREQTAAQRAAAQEAEYSRLMSMERPIDAADSVWIHQMTFLEVRDAQRAGKTTIIVPTGGIEQNGPYQVTGKHDHLNRVHCDAIARALGNALCAPIIHFVPQGDIDPPNGMMRYPGSIGVSETTYRALLTDVANSFRVTGFEHVVLIGDSGGNQRGMKEVAAELSPKWAAGKSRIHYIPEYYDWREATDFATTTLGWKQGNDGFHDDAVTSAMMMIDDPDSVRIKQRMAKGKATVNGIALTPVDKVVAAARQIVKYRVDKTAAAIRKAVSASTTGN
jgi:creatinine amidohydrolase/Fe(II)-dependent formamide hydrolase-like protein